MKLKKLVAVMMALLIAAVNPAGAAAANARPPAGAEADYVLSITNVKNKPFISAKTAAGSAEAYNDVITLPASEDAAGGFRAGDSIVIYADAAGMTELGRTVLDGKTVLDGAGRLGDDTLQTGDTIGGRKFVLVKQGQGGNNDDDRTGNGWGYIKEQDMVYIRRLENGSGKAPSTETIAVAVTPEETLYYTGNLEGIEAGLPGSIENPVPVPFGATVGDALQRIKTLPATVSAPHESGSASVPLNWQTGLRADKTNGENDDDTDIYLLYGPARVKTDFPGIQLTGGSIEVKQPSVRFDGATELYGVSVYVEIEPKKADFLIWNSAAETPEKALGISGFTYQSLKAGDSINLYTADGILIEQVLFEKNKSLYALSNLPQAGGSVKLSVTQKGYAESGKIDCIVTSGSAQTAEPRLLSAKTALPGTQGAEEIEVAVSLTAAAFLNLDADTAGWAVIGADFIKAVKSDSTTAVITLTNVTGPVVAIQPDLSVIAGGALVQGLTLAVITRPAVIFDAAALTLAGPADAYEYCIGTLPDAGTVWKSFSAAIHGLTADDIVALQLLLGLGTEKVAARDMIYVRHTADMENIALQAIPVGREAKPDPVSIDYENETTQEAFTGSYKIDSGPADTVTADKISLNPAAVKQVLYFWKPANTTETEGYLASPAQTLDIPARPFYSAGASDADKMNGNTVLTGDVSAGDRYMYTALPASPEGILVKDYGYTVSEAVDGRYTVPVKSGEHFYLAKPAAAGSFASVPVLLSGQGNSFGTVTYAVPVSGDADMRIHIAGGTFNNLLAAGTDISVKKQGEPTELILSVDTAADGKSVLLHLNAGFAPENYEITIAAAAVANGQPVALVQQFTVEGGGYMLTVPGYTLSPEMVGRTGVNGTEITVTAGLAGKNIEKVSVVSGSGTAAKTGNNTFIYINTTEPAGVEYIELEIETGGIQPLYDLQELTFGYGQGAVIPPMNPGDLADVSFTADPPAGISVAGDGTIMVSQAMDTGSYSFWVTGSNGAEIIVTVQINRAKLNIAVANREYNGKKTAEAAGLVTVFPAIPDVEAAGNLLYASKDAGTHRIDVSGLTLSGSESGNYEIDKGFVIQGTIEPAELLQIDGSVRVEPGTGADNLTGKILHMVVKATPVEDSFILKDILTGSDTEKAQYIMDAIESSMADAGHTGTAEEYILDFPDNTMLELELPAASLDGAVLSNFKEIAGAEVWLEINFSDEPADLWGPVITYDVGDYGFISMGSDTEQLEADVCYPTAIPVVQADHRYVFLGWSLDGAEVMDIRKRPVYTDTVYSAVYEKGFMQGDGNGVVRPEDKVTRAEFLKMIIYAAGQYDSTATYDVSMYTDVPGGRYYTNMIGYATEAGLAAGDGNGKFRPDSPITREEAARITAVTFGYDSPQSTGLITDLHKASAWARPQIAALVENGVIMGYQDDTFRPQGLITRAESASMISRADGFYPSDTYKMEIQSAYDSPFSDLASTHWGFAGILYAAGVIDE